jgi:hypothetical protein
MRKKIAALLRWLAKNGAVLNKLADKVETGGGGGPIEPPKP